MNYRYRTAPEAVLSDILARDPQASLHDIRHAHPSLRRLSLDQLGLRVGRLLDGRAARSLK
ncbi:hypothetical protein [Phenylobacterium soli]|uniref:Uncharacterized protein n=1 Tax=Phenylobacterium soli TaxID=2170551 RepID=A0A328AIW2_9CAUL|nr:hypothetical protein [Phenylobacterium soli]RAK53354.1 hypothetical protein DJ017_01825 [Phenylobacterium soli]